MDENVRNSRKISVFCDQIYAKAKIHHQEKFAPWEINQLYGKLRRATVPYTDSEHTQYL